MSPFSVQIWLPIAAILTDELHMKVSSSSPESFCEEYGPLVVEKMKRGGTASTLSCPIPSSEVNCESDHRCKDSKDKGRRCTLPVSWSCRVLSMAASCPPPASAEGPVISFFHFLSEQSCWSRGEVRRHGG